MSYFEAKMYQIRFWLGLGPKLRYQIQPECIHRTDHKQRDFINHAQTAQDMTEWRVISMASGLCV